MIIGWDREEGRADVKGEIEINPILSGIPEVSIEFRKPLSLECLRKIQVGSIDLDEIKFHQWVRLK